MLNLCFAALVFAVCAVLLKNFGWKGAPVFTVLCFVALLSELPSYFSQISELYSGLALTAEAAEAMLKIIGITYVFGISSDICKELGEGGIASALQLLGRLELVGVILPFITEIISLAVSLVGG